MKDLLRILLVLSVMAELNIASLSQQYLKQGVENNPGCRVIYKPGVKDHYSFLTFCGGINVPLGISDTYTNGSSLNFGFTPESDGYNAIRLNAEYVQLKYKESSEFRGATALIKSGADITLLDLKLDIIKGYLRPQSLINGFVNFSLAGGYFHEADYRLTYSENGNIRRTESHKGSNDGFVSLGIGGDASIRLNNHFRACTKVQYDFWFPFKWEIGSGILRFEAGLVYVIR